MSDESLNSCACCDTAPLAPQPPTNPPGLPALACRLGTHARFKAAMLAALAAKPALARLTSRADDDPAIALLDGWATVLDVLSFYQERIANEGYLRTATERRSVLELARSIGYELRPGVAASASLAFTLDTAREAPRQARIPKGAKVQSVPGQDEKPQTFETVEALDARAEWNELRPRLRAWRRPGFGDTQAALQGTATNLKPGDALLFVGAERERDPHAENWDCRRVVRVEPVFTGATEMDYTIVTWDRPLGKIAPRGPVAAEPKVFALRQRAALFGHNAPDWRSLPTQTRNNFLSGASREFRPDDWPGFSLWSLANLGLLGEYFANADFTGPRQLRVDPGVNLTGSAPESSLLPGTKSARWTGLVRARESGRHTFQTVTTGGFRLWLDGRLVVQNWSADPRGASAGEVYLEEGLHDLRLEFRPAGAATMQLRWSSRFHAAETVPASDLRPPVVHLDTVYPRIQAGGWVVLSQPLYQELYRVEEAVEDARTEFMLSVKTTRLTFNGEHLAFFNDQLRQAMVFGESEELAFAARPVPEPVCGQDLALDSPVNALAQGRRLLVSGRRVFAQVKAPALAGLVPAKGNPRTVKLVTGQTWRVTAPPVPAGAGWTTWSLLDELGAAVSCTVPEGVCEWVEEAGVTTEVAEVDLPPAVGKVDAPAAVTASASVRLREPLRHSYVRDSVRILGNVALATHGESQDEVLGSGDASHAFLKFELKQAPLTHVPAATASGAESTLEVRVADVLWREVPSLLEAGPMDRCFVARRSDDGKTTVRFGDGQRGARPPPGLENIRANYRVGLGLAGLLKANQLSLLLTRPLGVKGVTNPLPSAGAADPESRDEARQNAPFSVRTLGRVVSLLDSEDFARSFAGIGKAQAEWVWSGLRRVVFLTVAGAGGQALLEGLPPLTNLRAALEAAREPTLPAQVGAWTPLTFRLRARVLLEDGYLPDKVRVAVRAALLEAFGFERRAFGEGVAKSEVLAAIQAVEGVKAVDLDALDFSGGSWGLETFLPVRRARWSDTAGRILPAELLTLAADGIELKEMAE